MANIETVRSLVKRCKALGKAANKKGLLMSESRSETWTEYTFTSHVYRITFHRIADAETFIRALKTKGEK